MAMGAVVEARRQRVTVAWSARITGRAIPWELSPVVNSAFLAAASRAFILENLTELKKKRTDWRASRILGSSAADAGQLPRCARRLLPAIGPPDPNQWVASDHDVLVAG